ncbi:TIFY 8-like protein [Drosera capensis]
MPPDYFETWLAFATKGVLNRKQPKPPSVVYRQGWIDRLGRSSKSWGLKDTPPGRNLSVKNSTPSMALEVVMVVGCKQAAQHTSFPPFASTRIPSPPSDVPNSNSSSSMQLSSPSSTANTYNRLVMIPPPPNTTSTATNAAEPRPPAAVFHDFLGGGSRDSDHYHPKMMLNSPRVGVGHVVGEVALGSEQTPSTGSGSAAAVAVAGGGGRGPPFSSISDLDSVTLFVSAAFWCFIIGNIIVSFSNLFLPTAMVERQVGNPFKRIGCYSPRSDLSQHEVNNRLIGSKRGNMDSGFLRVSTDFSPSQMGAESPESSHVTKMLRQGPGGEHPRTLHHDGHFHGTQQMKLGCASLILQKMSSNQKDGKFSRWEHPISHNVGGNMQYAPQSGQASLLSYQSPSSRYRDVCASPSILSNIVADEGSRTGIKGSGVLSSVNTSKGLLEKNVSAALGSGPSGYAKTMMPDTDPDSSNPQRRHGLTSVSRQMTIIYGGQVHVFDDVHPNKAEIIMALAGSNGGSWSTNLPKSGPKSTPRVESCRVNGDIETTMADTALPHDAR